MEDGSASACRDGHILNLSDLPDHESCLDPVAAAKMVRLEDSILPCDVEVPPPPPPPSMRQHDSSSHDHGSSLSMDGGLAASWTPSENKMFEIALTEVDENDPLRREKIAAWVVSGKTAEQVKEIYLCLVEDINSIHLGRVPGRRYVDDPITAKKRKKLKEKRKKLKEKINKRKNAYDGKESKQLADEKMKGKEAAAAAAAATPKNSYWERPKSVPWTQKEQWYTYILLLDFHFN